MKIMLVAMVMIVVMGYSAEAAQTWKGMYTIKIIGEDNLPIDKVNIVTKFGSKRYRGSTDTNGIFVVKNNHVDVRMMNFSANKDGYYESGDSYTFWKTKKGCCLPWNKMFTVILRKIENPIPMYAKRVNTIVPVIDQFVGYDLQKGDWVAPYGSGQRSDFKFKIKKRVTSFHDFDSSLELVVSNVVDGLKEGSLKNYNSDFKLLRMAPDEYNIYKINLTNSSKKFIKYDDSQCYYFRVRSETNVYGKVTSAMYGKIRSYIGFGVRSNPTGTIQFTYYLNPTPNDRNLEFDPKKNLFKNLKSFEYPNAP